MEFSAVLTWLYMCAGSIFILLFLIAGETPKGFLAERVPVFEN
jgi:hypothetical protein